MCGIAACVGSRSGTERLVRCLENLEYRGYDSAGLAVRDGGTLELRKCAGQVDELHDTIPPELRSLDGAAGIAHTRWSTHGAPTETNAHPHTDCTGEIALVHNGIVDNYDALRAELEAAGHRFTSETDTEVIAHLVESRIAEGMTTAEAFRGAFDRVTGSYAVAAVFAGEDAVYATRNGSPLVVGRGEDTQFVASDVPAFVEYTDRVIFLEDGDFVRADADGVRVLDRTGDRIHRPTETVEWDPEHAEKAGYDHYVAKEIHEQPDALRRTLRGRIATTGAEVDLDDFPPGSFADCEEVHLVGMGTSYHAARYVAALLNDWGVPARACLAGEYAHTPPPVTDDTLAVPVTQSGETADTIAAAETARDGGARTLAVTNIVNSSITRLCDESLFIRAGPEIGVAATKTFSSQIATLVLLVLRIAGDTRDELPVDAPRLLGALRRLPDQLEATLDATSIRETAERFTDSEAYFFVGRGYAHAVALEGALKLKEISYVHAEGFPASQLKHGPLALVTESTPVVAVVTGDDESAIPTVNAVETRDAPVLAVANGSVEGIENDVDEVVWLPETHPAVAGILANVQLQLFAYHAADIIGRPIDEPRNPAESVTVE